MITTTFILQMLAVAAIILAIGAVEKWTLKHFPKPWWRRWLIDISIALPFILLVIWLAPADYKNWNKGALFLGIAIGVFGKEPMFWLFKKLRNGDG